MKKTSLILSALLLLFVFVSCNKSIVFDEKVEFENNNWTFEAKEVNFETTLKGSANPYAVILELELSGNPNVDMFYAIFTMTSPTGGTTRKQVVFNFVNPIEPYIQGASPNEKIYKLAVYPKRYFSETGTYSFEVYQCSTKADNYNIHALRLYIERLQEN